MREDFDREDFFPLTVWFCQTCTNVELGAHVSRERMFEDYYYLSSVNPGLVRHFESLAEELRGSQFVVDIGSNDGILLKPLKERGVRALGVDPSVNVSKIANDAGLETLVSFFDATVVRKICDDYGSPDVIVASSIFTHVEDPHQFIADAKELLVDEGRLIIEVEYVGTMLKHAQFERFYLDRIYYYSLTSLLRLADSHDMHIADAVLIEPHGGSVRVVIQKGKRALVGRALALAREEETVLTSEAMRDFSVETTKNIDAFRTVLTRYRHDGVRVAGYGAPARVSTICNYGVIGPDLIEYIVDDSSLKQGRYSPGTHIPIVSAATLADRKPDILVVFAYEYLDDIRKKVTGSFRYLIPIPPREV
jgi:SAM-dependent methyltransferase